MSKQQDLSQVICRYCKQPGHYKQKCPKLTDKPPRDNQSRQSDHSRLLRPGDNKKRQDITKSRDKIVIIEPIKDLVDEFPALCVSVLPSPPGWAGAKSFVDIAKTKVGDTKKQESDPNEFKLELLG